jgi:hypothetical protein
MTGPGAKKRSISGRLQRPNKKQRRQHAYHSDSEDEAAQDFDAVNLLDSDDDGQDAAVEDLSIGEEEGSSSSEDDKPTPLKKSVATKKTAKKESKPPKTSDDEDEVAEEDGEEGEDDAEDDGSDVDMGSDSDTQEPGKKSKSKRNDPSAFATSLSKILSTKLSTSKRADPVLSRSVEAHKASKEAVDSALEARAKRQMREQKRQAMEKGRVKDVLVPTTAGVTGEPDVSMADLLETERRLRKVAQRGVVKLFNAVRTAQVKASEAERNNRKQGVLGIGKREEKVNELSKKGFLDLIASGGGGLKKGALEEA